jgi:glutamate dehydrogenase/leucine dehydrogenase
VVLRPETVDESRFSSVVRQMAALTDLMYGGGQETFDLLPEECQKHLRLAFDRLNTELQQLTGPETGAPIQGDCHD